MRELLYKLTLSKYIVIPTIIIKTSIIKKTIVNIAPANKLRYVKNVKF